MFHVRQELQTRCVFLLSKLSSPLWPWLCPLACLLLTLYLYGLLLCSSLSVYVYHLCVKQHLSGYVCVCVYAYMCVCMSVCVCRHVFIRVCVFADIHVTVQVLLRCVSEDCSCRIVALEAWEKVLFESPVSKHNDPQKMQVNPPSARQGAASSMSSWTRSL